MSGIVICRLGAPVPGQSIPGSKVDLCSECGATIRVAPSGRKMLAQEGMRAVCTTCGKQMIEASMLSPEPLSGEQKTELIDAIGRRFKR